MIFGNRRTFIKTAAMTSIAGLLDRPRLAAAAENLPSLSAAADNKLDIYPLPACYAASEVFKVSVNGRPVPVIGYHNNARIEYYYAHFSFSGKIDIQITIADPIKYFRIRPGSYEIHGKIDRNNLTFSLSQSRYLMININEHQHLVLLADPIQDDMPSKEGMNVFDVSKAPYLADNTGRKNVTDILQKAIDAASNAKGTVYVPAGVYKISSITMKSNVGLYLEPGAVLRGTGKDADYSIVNPKAAKLGMHQRVTTFIQYAEGAVNMKVWGRGTLDANGEELFDDPEGKQLRINAIRPNKNSGVIIEGVIVCHSRWWTVTPHQCDNILIQNVKVLNTEFRLNTDGINIISSQNAQVKHCFIYANDDSLCAKPSTIGNFTGILEGPDESVHTVIFDDIVTYGQCHAAKVGLQGSTDATNIWFKNIQVVQARNAIAIQHYQGSGTMEDIHFVDINMEDMVFKAHKPYPIRMHITSKGNVRNVEVTNLTCMKFGNGTSLDGYEDQNSIIAGQGPESRIENVRFFNLRIAGKLILNKEMGHIDVNEYASNVTFQA